MKTFIKSIYSILFVLIISGSMLFQTGCKKKINEDTPVIPTKFTELKVASSFEFDNFANVDVNISVISSGIQSMNVVQIFQDDPANNGKLIATGATDPNSQYKTTLRVPARLTALWVGKISAAGNNEYVSVPINGKSLTYTFGKAANKSAEDILSNDCSTGCTKTEYGTKDHYTINSGDVVCVTTSAVFNNLTINTGGTLRVCGTVTVNDISNDHGTIIVTPSGTLSLPKVDYNFTIKNYGTLSFSGCGTIDFGGTLENWGSVSTSNKFIIKGTITNNGTFTVNEELTINTGEGKLINNCSFYVTSNSNNAFKQNNLLTNNSYLKVNGVISFSGNSTTTLGLQSLIESYKFDINGDINGPASQGSQIKGTNQSKTSSSCYLTGYVDLYASSISPDNAHYGTNGTKHAYVIPIPSCNNPVAPTITSSLQIGGLLNQPFTPYVFTATGTDPLTYNTITGLPAGLSYNASTRTISGTPTALGVTNVTLSVDNMMGTDTKTLKITIVEPPSPPVITSALTGKTTVNMPYTYLITASGSGTITYNATNLPAGLSFNAGTHEITGTPTVAGTYPITLTATNNPGGTDTKTLVLTVGTPPTITSALTASGTTGEQFAGYTLTAAGSPTIVYFITGLPAGLSYDDINHSIFGTPSDAGLTDVTLTATNDFGSDVKTLKITIVQAIIPPVITSPLTAVGVKNQSFTYTVDASGTQPIVYTATGLPPGLSFDGNTISGIPTIVGNTNVTLTATNSVGVDTKTLVINIVFAPGVDTDGDGVPDNLDAYPTDPERAFNSYYPNAVDYGTFVFEDLWPGYGDYDCNDLVVNFNYKTVTNANNNVVDLVAKLKIKAAGASLNNGFGISLPVLPENVASVTGCIKVGNSVIIDPKGYEAGSVNSTVIIPFDAVNTILGQGMVNTIIGGPTVQTELQTVTVHFKTPQASIGKAPFNPFMFVNQERGKEIHMKDQPSTELVNPVYFGTYSDASDPAKSFYYRSTTGLAWAFEIPVDFDYPIETVDILQTYLHFAEWAQSSGASYSDWYMDKPGYRNQENIYVTPQ